MKNWNPPNTNTVTVETGVRVWIAHECISDSPGTVLVSMGYVCPGYHVWCFDNGTQVSKVGEIVHGWQLIDRPVWHTADPTV